MVGIASLQNSDRKYDLGATSKVALVSLPKKGQSPQQTKEEVVKLWKLRITKPVDITHTVSNPRFWFEYVQPDSWGRTSYHRTESASFHLKVGDREILANLPDFEEISLNKLSKVGIKVSLKSMSRIETSGTPILRSSYSDRTLAHSGWFLVMDLADGSGMTVMLKEPTYSLKALH